jgi:hypothetical protein
MFLFFSHKQSVVIKNLLFMTYCVMGKIFCHSREDGNPELISNNLFDYN